MFKKKNPHESRYAGAYDRACYAAAAAAAVLEGVWGPGGPCIDEALKH